MESTPSRTREPGQLRRDSAEAQTAARSARIGDGGCGGSRASATRFLSSARWSCRLSRLRNGLSAQQVRLLQLGCWGLLAGLGHC